MTLQLSSIYVALTLLQALDLKPNYVRAWANMGISYANQVSSPLLIRALRFSSWVLYFLGLLYLNRKLLGSCFTLLIFICWRWIWEYVYYISVSLYHIIVNIYTQQSHMQNAHHFKISLFMSYIILSAWSIHSSLTFDVLNWYIMLM